MEIPTGFEALYLNTVNNNTAFRIRHYIWNSRNWKYSNRIFGYYTASKTANQAVGHETLEMQIQL